MWDPTNAHLVIVYPTGLVWDPTDVHLVIVYPTGLMWGPTNAHLVIVYPTGLMWVLLLPNMVLFCCPFLSSSNDLLPLKRPVDPTGGKQDKPACI